MMSVLADSKYLANFVITVDDSNVTDSTNVCYQFNQPAITPGQNISVVCNQALVGRYVTIKRLVMDPQPRSLCMCEFQVYGIKLTGRPALYIFSICCYVRPGSSRHICTVHSSVFYDLL